MASKAVRPLDPAAVRAANAGLYQRHPELLSSGRGRQLDPTSPQDAALRAEWMALYQQAGGQVEPVSPKTVATAKAQVDQQFSSAPVGSPQTPCAAAGKQTTAPPPPQPARSLPPQSPGEPPCELVTLKVTCGHGRSPGPERRLMVVGSGPVTADQITTDLQMKGGCGVHPSWDYGPSPAGAGKSASFKFDATAKSPLDSSATAPWWHQQPTSHRAGASACTGVPGDFEIIAYPGGYVQLDAGASFKFKSSGKPGSRFSFSGQLKITYGSKTTSSSFDFYKLGSVVEKAIDWISLIYADEEPEFGDITTKKGWEVSTSPGIKIKSEWKEDPGSWQAYCNTTLELGCKPLINVGGELPLAKAPIPSRLERWVKAGAYVKGSGEVSLTTKWEWQDWPLSERKSILADEVQGVGQIKIAVIGKAHLFAKDFISGSISGESGFKFTFSSTKTCPPGIVVHFTHDGLKVKLKGEVLWGFWETNKEFTLIDPSATPTELHRWYFDE